jgi:hypothetical protein
LKLPKLSLPRPQRWDFIAGGVLAAGLALVGFALFVAFKKPEGEPFPAFWTPIFLFAQLAVAMGGVMVLGKTAKEGTWWGNLASVAALLVGISGVLLSAALWAAA